MKYMLSIDIKIHEKRKINENKPRKDKERKKQHEDIPHAHIYFHPYPINHGT